MKIQDSLSASNGFITLVVWLVLSVASVPASIAAGAADGDGDGGGGGVKQADSSGHNLNLPIPTFGGMQLWEDLTVLSGWRVQRNVVTGHARLLDQKDVRRAWGTLADCNTALEAARLELGLKPSSEHGVVLLHGLGRTKSMFRSLEARLRLEGYEVVTINYPSMRRPISEHADQVETVLGNLEGIKTVSFVTHSLGGIVMREVLSRDGPWRATIRPARMVMMGPPNQGSSFARDIPKAGTDQIVGASLDELRHIDISDFPAPDIDFAIIAGGRGEEGFNPLIEGNDDGVVGVSETRLQGMKEMLIVEGLHSFLPSHPQASEATLNFIAHGSFNLAGRHTGQNPGQ